MTWFLDMWLVLDIFVICSFERAVEAIGAFTDSTHDILSLFNHSTFDWEYHSTHRRTGTSEEVRRRCFAAHVAERVMYKLKYNEGEPPNVSLDAICPLRAISCSSSKYRLTSGICNNVVKPYSGSALSAFQRVLPPDYGDDISSWRRSANGRTLPNPGDVADLLFSSTHKHYSSTPVSALFVQWSRFLYDDMAAIAPHELSEDMAPSCCFESRHPECAPFYERDPSGFCNPYVRSQVAPAKRCRPGPREQMNMGSSFIDGGTVYGRSIEEAEWKRTRRRGQIREDDLKLAVTVDVALSSKSSLERMWTSEHNRVAAQLKELNPSWDDEQLFQEARRIIVAQIQFVTVHEYLPLLIGKEAMTFHHIMDPLDDSEDVYDAELCADTINAFAAVIGKFYLAMKHPGAASVSPFHEDDLKVLLGQAASLPGLGVLQQDKTLTVSSYEVNTAAYLVHRGRDHGIPSFVKWHEHCTGRKITSFDDLWDLVTEPREVVPALEKLYQSIEDVDLIVLALAEKPVLGSLVGSTLSCILGKQYRKVMHGDRYWYSNSGAFSLPQLRAITGSTTLAQVICRFLGKDSHVQPKAFMVSDDYSNFPALCNSTGRDENFLVEWKDEYIEYPMPDDDIKRLLEKAENVVKHRKSASSNSRQASTRASYTDPFQIYAHMMRPKEGAVKLSGASDVLLEATKLLISSRSSRHPLIGTFEDKSIVPKLNLDWFISQYCPPDECLPEELPCDHTSKFRLHSGWCNNLQRPERGTSFRPLIYLLPPEYEDGIDEPRSTSSRGTPLPNPRVISNVVHHEAPIFHTKYSHMIMQFGQFIGHEITHAPLDRGPGNEALNCTSCDSFDTVSPSCLPIPIPGNDPFFAPFHDGSPRCLAFVRSLNGQRQLGPRRQINQLTAYIDGSVIYGSTACEADALRAKRGGRLISTVASGSSRELLQQAEDQSECRSARYAPCFTSGDERVSQHPGITSMHTLFLREHNRIATELSSINPHWNDETLYQETRRLVAAQLAHITFNEYLPKVVGNDLADKHDLRPRPSGYFNGYDSSCDPSISHSFSTASYRFGHSLTRRFFPRLDSHYHNATRPMDLAMNFEYADVVYDERHGGIEALLLGMVDSSAMLADRHITEALRNYLFAERGVPQSGLDLASINIMRGRDHGVPPYAAHREFCGLSRPVSFEDLSDEVPSSVIEALRAVYESVDDIDLFTGVLSETPIKGAIIGPTAACIVAEQFSRIKKCDRFHYENPGPQQFTSDQLQEIRRVTLSSLICANNEWIRKVQPDAFSLPESLVNVPSDCRNYHRIDLTKWADHGGCRVSDFTTIAEGETVRRSPCTNCTCTKEGLRCRAIPIHDCHDVARKFSRKEVMANSIISPRFQDVSCVVQCASALQKHP